MCSGKNLEILSNSHDVIRNDILTKSFLDKISLNNTFLTKKGIFLSIFGGTVSVHKMLKWYKLHRGVSSAI